MDDELRLTRVEIAQRLGVSVGALRKWEEQFSAWIETPAGTKGYGQPRVFSQHDVLVFGAIAKARKEGKRIDDIRAELDTRLATLSPDDVPGATPDEAQQQRVKMALYIDTVKALENAEGELTATRNERDRLRDQLDEAHDRLIDAEKRAAAAEAQRDMLAATADADRDKARPTNFWQRWLASRQKPE